MGGTEDLPRCARKSRLGLAGQLARRWLALFIVLQVAGVFTAALTIRAGVERGCGERCADGDDGSGTPCAPLCPTCSCVHGRIDGLPVQLGCGVTVFLPDRTWSPPTLADPLPDSPDSDGIFHPPRALPLA